MAIPYSATGSLCPCFQPDRLVGLSVKPASANALSVRLPFVLSGPWEASVTLLEATTPVKLPSKRCPPSPGVRPHATEGWYFNSDSLQPGGHSSQSPTYPTHPLHDASTKSAGRNLPDKEFRYLRTVIVTAAVYRGFNSDLRSRLLSPPLNLPAPGRCQAIFFILRFSIALCFW